MTGLDLVLGLLGFLLTLAVFSYLLGDNLFFRTALYLLAGVSSGYAAALILTKVILPYLILPLGKPGTATFYLSLAPLLLSVVLLAILIPRRQQWAKLPLAFLVGVVAAVALSGVLRGTLAPQLLAALQPFDQTALIGDGTNAWLRLLEALLGLLGLISVLFVFHHYQRSRNGVLTRSNLIEGVSTIGQVFLGITFAALFVGIYATALIALISRLSWLRDFFGLLFAR